MDTFSAPTSEALKLPQSKQPTQRYREEDWKPHRDLIISMYPTKGMTLRSIRTILDESHDFIVTERQLKRKVEKWNLEKNINSTEMNFIVLKQQQRHREGKIIRFRARGQPVKQAKIERWQKRNGGSMQSPISSIPPKPEDICYSPASIGSPMLDTGYLPTRSPNFFEYVMDSPTSTASSSAPDLVIGNPQPIFVDEAQFDLQQIMATESVVFEGQSPVPFTPMSSPTSLMSNSSAEERFPTGVEMGNDSSPQHTLEQQGTTHDVRIDGHELRPCSLRHPQFLYELQGPGNPGEDEVKVARKARFMEKEEHDFSQRLDAYQSEFGSDHPATLDTMSRLARILRNQSRLLAAESLFVQVAEKRQTLLGGSNPLTIGAQLDVARILRDQSKLASAETLCRHLHDQASRFLAPTHRLSLSIKNTLAFCLGDRGSEQEAEQLLRESIGISGPALAADDDLLLEAMRILADLLLNRGQTSEAERILLAVLEANDAIRALRTRAMLGRLYYQTGRYQEAADTLREVLSGEDDLSRPEHEQTLRSRQLLAMTWGAMNRHQESEHLLQNTFRQLRRSLGSRHISTLWCQQNLAKIMNDQEKYEEGEAILKEVLELSEALGPTHRLACHSWNELGHSYEGHGWWNQAFSMFSKAFDVSQRKRGASHMDTISYSENLTRFRERMDQV